MRRYGGKIDYFLSHKKVTKNWRFWRLNLLPANMNFTLQPLGMFNTVTAIPGSRVKTVQGLEIGEIASINEVFYRFIVQNERAQANHCHCRYDRVTIARVPIHGPAD